MRQLLSGLLPHGVHMSTPPSPPPPVPVLEREHPPPTLFVSRFHGYT